MQQYYQVIFDQLADPSTLPAIKTIMRVQFKFSQKAIDAFFSGQAIMRGVTHQRAQQQQSLFHKMGVNTHVTPLVKHTDSDIEPKDVTPPANIDKRTIEALDYINSCLIRLEDKIDDLSCQVAATQTSVQVMDEEDEDWSSPPKCSNTPAWQKQLKWVMLIAAVILVFFTITAIDYFNPQFFHLST